MKDFYDLALFARMYSFAGQRLAQAVAATFRHRGTIIEVNRLALRKHVVMIPHELSNGVHSCAAAALVKRSATWNGSWAKSDVRSACAFSGVGRGTFRTSLEARRTLGKINGRAYA